HLHALRQPALQRRLQRVVLVPTDVGEPRRLRGAAEALEQRPPRVAEARYLAGVLIEDLVDLALSGAHVPDLAGEAPAQLLLHRDVERPDVAALWRLIEGARRDIERNGNHTAAHVWHRDLRNAGGKRARVLEGVRRGDRQVDRGGVVAEDVADEGKRIRVVVDAESAADHQP